MSMCARLMSRSLFLLAAFFIAAAQAAAAGEGGKTIDLSGAWKYLPYEGMTDLSKPEIDDASWPDMTLPSNWFLKGSRDYPVGADVTPPQRGRIGNWGEMAQSQPNRGFDYSGHVWFRRHF